MNITLETITQSPSHIPSMLPKVVHDTSGIVCLTIESLLLILNIFPILVVCKLKKAKDKTVTDEIVVFLSVTDMISVLAPAPLWVVAYLSHRWYGGAQTCHFYQLTTHWFPLTSMCLVTYMCVDRWMVLYLASSYKGTFTNPLKTRAIVVLIYIVTLIISSLPVFGMGPEALSPSGKLCENWLTATPTKSREHVFYISFLVFGYLNLLITVVVNIAVIFTLQTLQKKFSQAMVDRRATAQPIDKRTVTEFTVMSLMVTLVFYLTWLPALVLITAQKSGYQVAPVAVMYAIMSTTLTGLANPIIYGIFSHSYRKGYRRILKGLLKVVFGCQSEQEFEVLDDGMTSGVAERLHSTLSAANSIAALLPGRQSEGLDGGTSLLEDNHDNQPNGHLVFTECTLETYAKEADLDETTELTPHVADHQDDMEECHLEDDPEDSTYFLNKETSASFSQTGSIMQESVI